MSDILGRVFFGELNEKPDASKEKATASSFDRPRRPEPLSLQELAEQLGSRYRQLIGWAAEAMKGQSHKLDLLISEYGVSFSEDAAISYEDGSIKTDIYEIRCQKPNNLAFSVVIVSQYFKDQQVQQWYNTVYNGPSPAERTDAEWDDFHEVSGQACPVEELEVVRMIAEVVGMPI